MNIDIKKTNIKLTPLELVYIENKLNKMDKYLDCADGKVKASIEIEKTLKHQSGNIFRAEIQFYLPRRAVRAEAVGESWRQSFDEARRKIQRELVKYKETKC